MHLTKLAPLIAFVGLGFAYGVVGCGGGGDGKGTGGSGGKPSSGGSGGKITGGSGGKVTGGSGGGGSDTGGSGGSTGGSGGSTGGSGGSTGGSGGTSGSTGGTAGTPTPPPDCTKATPDLTTGIVGYGTFDEGTGIDIADASGNSNIGKLVEGANTQAADHTAPAWAAGKKGMGLKLDGVDDWIRVPDSETLDATGINNGVSATAWVKIDKVNTVKDFNFIIIRHELGTRLEHFGLGMFQGLPQAAVHFFKAVGPQNVPIGEWVHLSQTYDGITTRLYVNGAEVSFLDVGWPIAADETPLTIGAGINEEDVIEHLAGTVDEVRLYSRELTACEVQEAMK